VDFGALDGQPVSTLFTFISPTVRAHLHLLSRLGFVLQNPEFKKAITRQAARDEILETLARVEATVAPRPASGSEKPISAGTTSIG